MGYKELTPDEVDALQLEIVTALKSELAATKERLARAEAVVSASAFYFSLDTLENNHREFWEAEQDVKLKLKAYRESEK